MIEILRKLSHFADIADSRAANGDKEVVAHWQNVKGSKVLTAMLTLADARAARAFLTKIGKAQAEAKPAKKAAFGGMK